MVEAGRCEHEIFHMHASHRKHKTRIQSLETESGIATTPAELEEAINLHFDAIVGTDVPCSEQFNWDQLGLSTPDLSKLDAAFTMEEIKTAIFDSQVDKAPGPDGFSGTFFRTAWNTIKYDLLLAANKFHSLDDTLFRLPQHRPLHPTAQAGTANTGKPLPAYKLNSRLCKVNLQNPGHQTTT